MTEISNRSRVAVAAPALFTFGGIAAAFGLATCCALPIVLATFGLGTAWLGGIALFTASHRPVFLVIAVLGLIGGAGLLGWHRRRVPPAVRWITVIGLLIGVVLLYYGYTYA